MARNRNDQGEKGDTLLTRQDSMNRRRELPKTEEQEREYLNQIFIDLYSICKELLSDNQSVPLKVDATTINAYVKEVASEPLREVDLGSLRSLPDAPLPSIPFDESKFRF